MNVMDLLRQKVRPCLVRMNHTPYWGCDLPDNHGGDHVSLHANAWNNNE